MLGDESLWLKVVLRVVHNRDPLQTLRSRVQDISNLTLSMMDRGCVRGMLIEAWSYLVAHVAKTDAASPAGMAAPEVDMEVKTDKPLLDSPPPR